MDITVDLPAEVAEQAEQLGIYEFERCIYDPDTRRMTASVTTTFYRKGAWYNEEDFVFLGLISMMDPPRTESKEAVKNAKEAGIKSIMITGDHKETARAIAEKIGIYNENDFYVLYL